MRHGYGAGAACVLTEAYTKGEYYEFNSTPRTIYAGYWPISIKKSAIKLRMQLLDAVQFHRKRWFGDVEGLSETLH